MGGLPATGRPCLALQCPPQAGDSCHFHLGLPGAPLSPVTLPTHGERVPKSPGQGHMLRSAHAKHTWEESQTEAACSLPGAPSLPRAPCGRSRMSCTETALTPCSTG